MSDDSSVLTVLGSDLGIAQSALALISFTNAAAQRNRDRNGTITLVSNSKPHSFDHSASLFEAPRASISSSVKWDQY